MACGIALKRPLELDPYLSPDGVKRPRTTSAHCSPLRPTFLNSMASISHPSLFASTTPASSTSEEAAASKSSSSPFGALNSSPLGRKQLESYLYAEIRSLRRRKLLPKHRKPQEFRAPHSPGHSSDSDGDHPGSSTHSFSDSKAGGPDGEKPQFTFKQVRMICERLLKEQESQLRHQYEGVLNTKLGEQYDQFVKFTQDQLHRQSETSQLSYLS